MSGWYLSRWLTLLGLVAVVATAFRSWPNPWPIVAVGGLFVAYVAVLAWASRLGYLRFTPGLDPSDPFQKTIPAPAPRYLERLPVRASGLFRVEGEEQYYVDLDADFQTAATQEHMVLARVHPSRQAPTMLHSTLSTVRPNRGERWSSQPPRRVTWTAASHAIRTRIAQKTCGTSAFIPRTGSLKSEAPYSGGIPSRTS